MSQGENRLSALSNALKPTFLRWEKLRIPYNFILALILILSHAPTMGLSFVYLPALFVWLVGAVLANLLFLAGPLAEAYFAWIGLRSRWITLSLFLGGILISIPCVMFFKLPFAYWIPGFD